MVPQEQVALQDLMVLLVQLVFKAISDLQVQVVLLVILVLLAQVVYKDLMELQEQVA